MSLAYVGFGGVPMGRGLRECVAWYGDVDLIPHLLHVLSSGAVDVTVSWGEAMAYDMSADRKTIARDAERSVRRMTAAALVPRHRREWRRRRPSNSCNPGRLDPHGTIAPCGFKARRSQCDPVSLPPILQD